MFDRHELASENLYLEQIYSDLHTIISNALAEAEKSGKKLLVIAGEQHSSLYSFLLQVLLLLVVKDHGIKNLIVEFPEKFVNSILSSPRPVKTLNTEFSIPFARRKLKMSIIPADLDYIQLNPSNENKDGVREEEMIRCCHEKIKDHALFIAGSNHVKPLSEQLKAVFHVVPINISKITVLETIEFNCIRALNFINPKILDYGPSDLGERYDFIKNSKEVIQIEYPVNLDYLCHQKIISSIRKWHETLHKPFLFKQLSESSALRCSSHGII